MIWGLGLVGALLMATGWVVRAVRTPTRDLPPSPPRDGGLPADPELEAAFADAERELDAGVLATLLQPVIERAVPLRAIRAAPITGTTRLGFADGTVVLVRSQGGELGRLALRVRVESITLVACTPVGREAELVFHTGHGSVRARAVGLDQAD